jgi:hypothetical protein
MPERGALFKPGNFNALKFRRPALSGGRTFPQNGASLPAAT